MLIKLYGNITLVNPSNIFLLGLSITLNSFPPIIFDNLSNIKGLESEYSFSRRLYITGSLRVTLRNEATFVNSTEYFGIFNF